MAKKNPKYKHTKRLVRIAHEVGGLSYEAIAQRARLSGKSKSQVYRWMNGSSFATVEQMQALLKEFGHYLRKETEHVYYCLELVFTERKIKKLLEEGAVFLERAEQLVPLSELDGDELADLVGKDFSDLRMTKASDQFQIKNILFSVDVADPKFTYFKIRGEKVFQHTLHHGYAVEGRTRSSSDHKIKKIAQYRIQVIKQTESCWYVVLQDRAMSLTDETSQFAENGYAVPVCSSVDSAIWSSRSYKAESYDGVISFIDNYAERFCRHPDCQLEAKVTLPYIIRSKFAELGYHLDEIVDITEEDVEI